MQGRSLLFSLLGLYFIAFKYTQSYILACLSAFYTRTSKKELMILFFTFQSNNTYKVLSRFCRKVEKSVLNKQEFS